MQALLPIILFVGLFIWLLPESKAERVSVCNASPFEISIAVGYKDDSENVRTHGWFNQSPGECNSWDTGSEKFYYYAEASEKLARWVNGGNPYRWANSIFSFNHSLCVDPSNKFNMVAKAECPTKHRFLSARLTRSNNQINLYHEYHQGIPLEETIERRHTLIGKMNYEEMIRSTPEREPPFQLGFDLKNNPSGGATVTRLYEGMPAELEGMLVGDTITNLGGYKINNVEDVNWVLDELSIFNTEPLSITMIAETGEIVNGVIEPMFYPFSHKDYSEGGKVSTFLASTVDGVFFGGASELGCGAFFTIAEGLSAVFSDRGFDTQQTVTEASSCSHSVDMELQKNALLYEDAAIAGLWASILMPGTAVFKGAKILKGGKAAKIPLAAKSRFVSSKNLRQSLKRLRNQKFNTAVR